MFRVSMTILRDNILSSFLLFSAVSSKLKFVNSVVIIQERSIKIIVSFDMTPGITI